MPAIVFQLDIPQIMPVMSALCSRFFWPGSHMDQAAVVTQVLEEFQQIVLSIVTKVVIPILPVFIAFTFCALSYEGLLQNSFLCSFR